MFEFYKELYLRLSGLEPRKKQSEDIEKDNRFISNRTRIIIWIMGIFYLIVAAVGISGEINNGEYSIFFIKYVVGVIVDIAAIILVTMKNKKCQIAGIICVVLFVFINFV